MAIGLSFLLNLFSVAIGLTAFSTDSHGVENLALVGLVATALGIVVSMFASGWMAGYLGSYKRHLGALYGFLAWCLALIVMVFIAEYLMKYIAFYTHFISGAPVDEISHAMQTNSHALVQTKVVISTYIVFCLFFLSAFACSLGGHCGMQYIDRE